MRNSLYLCSICFVVFFSSYGQAPEASALLRLATTELNNGNYIKAIEVGKLLLSESESRKKEDLISKSLNVIALSQIGLAKYDEAESSLNKSYENLSNTPLNNVQKAKINIIKARLYKSRKEYAESLKFSKSAVLLAPGNEQILGEHYLNVGRILYALGYDVSAVIYLERAEKIFANKENSAVKFETLRFLSLSWQAKSNYTAAFNYSEKLIASAAKTQFKFQYRQALLEYGYILSATGHKKKAFSVFEKGLKISVEERNSAHECLFLSTLLANSLYENDIPSASKYLLGLQAADKNNKFFYEILLAKAELAAFSNNIDKSRTLLKELEQNGGKQYFPLLYKKIKIAQISKDWNSVIESNNELLELSLKYNYRDDLPGLFLTFAKAYYQLNQIDKSVEYAEKCLAYSEQLRQSENTQLSLSLFEIYHDAYRLLSEVNLKNSDKAFELADLLKARLLKDKIENNPLTYKTIVSPEIRQKLETLSTEFIDNQNVEPEISRYEKLVTNQQPDVNFAKFSPGAFNKLSYLENVAIISYLFTLDNKLICFVWEKDKPVKAVRLEITKGEVDELAKDISRKIKNFVFFKRDGKQLYDRLLNPLELKASHLIIIPDKSLWKIPFQALSEDGKTYLIENKVISYAPSASVLFNQIAGQKPVRRTAQVFSNSTYNNLYLSFADSEAADTAALFKIQPHLNSTIEDFKKTSDKSDILHFAMHAEINEDEPFNSFLSFRPGAKSDGKLKVEELFDMSLKKRSLVFLASCDTSNVFNSEGIVSLAWGMMDAGASSVISAQWEANDRSTSLFTKAFYRHYKQGISTAEAVQAASKEIIFSKTPNLNEPYYWAEFTLSGDFR